MRYISAVQFFISEIGKTLVRDINGRTDPILSPFLAEPDEQRRAAILSSLIEDHAQPVICRIIRTTLPNLPRNDSASIDDLKSEVILRVIRSLESFRSDRLLEPFPSFTSYVAVVSYNTCHDYLRNKNPERARLKKRIRYALSHSPELAVRQHDRSTWLCGLAEWSFSEPTLDQTGLETSVRGCMFSQPSAGSDCLDPRALLIDIFRLAGVPIELDSLVEAIAELLGIDDLNILELSLDGEVGAANGSHLRAEGSLQSVEFVMTARHLWGEVCRLSHRERVALILSMKDDRGVDGVSLLTHSRAASLEEISIALEIPAAKLVMIWDQLPLNDAATGQLIGVTSRQVADLRRSARKRLARRTFGARGNGAGSHFGSRKQRVPKHNLKREMRVK
ncbi:MAG TPA: sigma factor [Blastocatellia bacterium]